MVELNLAGFACIFCHAPDALTNQWPEGEPTCPRCGKDALQELGFYFT
jgi:hypothetical protein